MKNYDLKFNPNRRVAPQCPCGKNNSDGKFQPYIGYIDKGYCFSCGQTFLPNISELKSTQSSSKSNSEMLSDSKILEEPSYIDVDLVYRSQKNYEINTLYNFIANLTDIPTAEKLKRRYLIGTSKEYNGSMIFWYVDIHGRVRTGKVMEYKMCIDKTSSIGINCNRVKSNYPPLKWVHKLKGGANFKLQSCFFGEHLLTKFPDRKIALVESEKSAIISSAYFPDYIWLACGGADGLTNAKVKALMGRDVVLFPDLGKLSLWSEKAKLIHKNVANVKIKVSNYLEFNATESEREKGLDIADYIIRENFKTFVNPDPETEV